MQRILVRFGSAQQKVDALQSVALAAPDGSAPKFLFAQPNVLHTVATDATRARLETLGAEIFEDVQFSVFPGDEYDDPEENYRPTYSPQNDLADYTLRDVMEQISAPGAWKHTRGEGVTIAIVDSGIAGARREFAPARRSPVDLDSEHLGKHWIDPHGHGTMCAAIAAGSQKDGGRHDGVAPGATLLAARSTLKSTDLLDIYDELLRARSEGKIRGPLVVSNSYGLYVCNSPAILPHNHPYMTSILAAIESGIFVCFAAGNNHYDTCKYPADAHGPNSIWGPNSHDEVVSVGTVNREFTNCDPLSPHVNSSRGPGEWAVKNKKPDCVAPTYGEIPWGTMDRKMRWWGTSGACPQVAGAAALMLSVCPSLTPAEVADGIRDTCSRIVEAPTCVGRGLLDCEAAVGKALSMRPSS